MMNTITREARISSRIDSKLKAAGDAILAELGVKPSQAISMFYAQIVRQRGLPLELKLPNEETVQALKEDVTNNPNYRDIDEAFADLAS